MKLLVTLAYELMADVAIQALRQVLEQTAMNIAPEDLRAVASLENVVQIRRTWCGDSFTRPVNCSHVKQLARQELIRRGLEA